MKDFGLEILTGQWADLKPHLERGAVFVVSEELDLALVGSKVAEDDVVSVQAWLKDAMLARPTEQQISAWDHVNGPQFRFVIVAPYVLVQTVPH
jgi:hypothetical protein